MAKVKCQYKIIVVKVNHKNMTVAHHSVNADGTRRLIHALSWSKLKFYNAYDDRIINERGQMVDEIDNSNKKRCLGILF